MNHGCLHLFVLYNVYSDLSRRIYMLIYKTWVAAWYFSYFIFQSYACLQTMHLKHTESERLHFPRINLFNCHKCIFFFPITIFESNSKIQFTTKFEKKFRSSRWSWFKVKDGCWNIYRNVACEITLHVFSLTEKNHFKQTVN